MRLPVHLGQHLAHHSELCLTVQLENLGIALIPRHDAFLSAFTSSITIMYLPKYGHGFESSAREYRRH